MTPKEMSKIFNEIEPTREIHGKARSKRPLKRLKKSSEIAGEADAPSVLATKKFNPETFREFSELKCALDYDIAIMNELKNEHVQVIASMVDKYGIDTKNKKGDLVKVIYAEPYKAQVRYREIVGDFNLEAARKHFPSMVNEEVTASKVDLSLLEKSLHLIPNTSSEEARKLTEAINLIKDAALRLNNPEIYEESTNESISDELLILLNEGKIDSKIKTEIMGSDKIELELSSIRIESLVEEANGRCQCCGHKKTSLEAKNPKFICPECNSKE